MTVHSPHEYRADSDHSATLSMIGSIVRVAPVRTTITPSFHQCRVGRRDADSVMPGRIESMNSPRPPLVVDRQTDLSC